MMAWTDRTRSTERRGVEIRLYPALFEFGGGGSLLSLENYVPQDAKIDKEDVRLLVRARRARKRVSEKKSKSASSLSEFSEALSS